MAGQKKYVFRELVRDTSDPIQLIAYAFYKKHKDTMAAGFERDYGPAAVPGKLESWHDLIASDQTHREHYLTTAKTFVAVIKDEIENEVRQDVANEHGAAIGALTAQHQLIVAGLKDKVTNAEKKARDEWSEKMSTWAVQETTPSKFTKGFLVASKYIGGTLAAAFSTALVTGLMVFILTFFSPTISATANSVAKGIIDKLLPPDDPSGLAIDSYTVKKDAAKPGTPPANENKP